MENRREIPSLHVLKALCALFVVMIHIPFYGQHAFSPIIVCAVPCFFLISGYFLYSEEIVKVREKLRKGLKKIFIAILAINAVYVFWRVMQGNSPSWKQIADIFITGTRINLPLWYLTAYAWAIVLLLFFVRKSDRALYFFPFFILACLLMGRYNFVFFHGIGFAFCVRGNALTIALPIVSLGYLLHKYEVRLLSFRHLNILPVIVIVLSYIELYLLERFAINNSTSYLVCTLPLACSLFLLALKHKDFYVPFVCEIGKIHSANIYYFHILTWDAILSHISAIYSIGAATTFIATLCGSVVLVWLQGQMQRLCPYRFKHKETQQKS